MNRQHLIETARGDRAPDLVLKNGRILEVFTGTILQADIAITDGWIAGIGQYDGQMSLICRAAMSLPGLSMPTVMWSSSMALPGGLL